MTGEPLSCSRRLCQARAEWQILWNNPKIHSPDRRKIWLSCANHQNWLENYLKERQLWRETVPVSELPKYFPQEGH